MNNIQPQSQPAPMPQQVQQPIGYTPQQVQQPMSYAPQQIQQPAPMPQAQGQNVNFYGVEISPQESQLINQLYIGINSNLGIQLSESSTVFKSLYFGCRDMFKTLYVNQISNERGSRPTTPDYEKAQQVFEQVFGSVAQPKVDERTLCLTMKAFAPSMLPDPVAGQRSHVTIMEYILDLNWHSQNVRQNSNTINRSNNGNGIDTNNANTNPYAVGNAQSKAAAGFVPQQQAQQPMGYAPQQVQQPVGFVPQQQVQRPTGYAPQQAAQAVMAGMPAYAQL